MLTVRGLVRSYVPGGHKRRASHGMPDNCLRAVNREKIRNLERSGKYGNT